MNHKPFPPSPCLLLEDAYSVCGPEKSQVAESDYLLVPHAARTLAGPSIDYALARVCLEARSCGTQVFFSRRVVS